MRIPVTMEGDDGTTDFVDCLGDSYNQYICKKSVSSCEGGRFQELQLSETTRIKSRYCMNSGLELFFICRLCAISAEITNFGFEFDCVLRSYVDGCMETIQVA